jgi:putative transposase
MAHVCNFVHCVWGTKNRFPYFNSSNTRDIMTHISEKSYENGIYIDHLNAYRDHMHCLISLDPNESLAKVVKQIKGESSHWINQNLFLSFDFKWAHEYYATSVSRTLLPTVRQYIQNQEIHHQNKSWQQEELDYQALITKLLTPFRLDR